MNEINIAAIVAELRVATSNDQALDLLKDLPPKALRLVATTYDPYLVLRGKAGQSELVRTLIRKTVGMRLWVRAWKAEQA